MEIGLKATINGLVRLGWLSNSPTQQEMASLLAEDGILGLPKLDSKSGVSPCATNASNE